MTASTGRADYDGRLRWSAPADGEPVFVLRGQDELAADTIRAWASLARASGVDRAVVEQALQQADRFSAWPDRRLPDASHLTDAERKQLAYQFGRRAYHAHADFKDVRLLLAEERGLNEAMGKLRPILRALLDGLTQGADGAYAWAVPTDDRGAIQNGYLDPFEALRDFRELLETPPARRVA